MATRQVRSAIAWLTRAVPTASNGFMAATSTNPSAAAIRPSRGITSSCSAIAGDEDVEGLLGDPVELLEVEQRALPHRGGQRTVGPGLRAVADAHDQRRIVMAEQPRRSQLGVALHELHPPPRCGGDRSQQRRLASPGRAVEDHVAALLEGDGDHFGLAAEADDPVLEEGEQLSQCSWMTTPRMF